MTAHKFVRQAIVAVAVAAVAPLALVALDMTPHAMAQGNGNGHANGHSDGHGNGHGSGHGNGHGNAGGNQSASAGSGLNKGQTKKTEKMTAKMTRQMIEEDPSMAPSALGKLNGVLNASTNALMHASPNSPIGMAGTTLKEALLAAEALNTDEDPTNDVSPEQLAAELADVFDGMTNKPLTEAQVLAVMDRVAELDPTLSRYDLDVEQTPEVTVENETLAQDVADEVNSFDLAGALSDLFDGDEDDTEEGETLE